MDSIEVLNCIHTEWESVVILAEKNWGGRKDWGSGGEAPRKILKTTPFRS